MNRQSWLRIGKSRLPISLPSHAKVLRANPVEPLPNPQQAIAESISDPIESKPIKEIVKSKSPKNAVITISDITRPVPNKIILPPIIEAIGLPPEKITILIATGLHRPSTIEEKIQLVGEKILSEHPVIDHLSGDPNELIALPHPSVFGTQVSINKHYMNADIKIVTGFIEPHFMAGFSGGRKGVCPGLANMETVRNFHGFQFLNSEKATNFQLDGNPLHEEATSVAKMAGIDFLVNVALTESKEIAAVFSGDWQQAFLKGTEFVKSATSAPIDHKVDLVITCCGGDPLDKTLYQSGKGMCTGLPILSDNAIEIVASACSEGLGSASFSQIMKTRGNQWQPFMDEIANSNEILHDQWGFQMQCKVLEKIGVENLLFATDGIPKSELEQMSLTPIFDGNWDCIQNRINQYADRSMAILPDGPYVVPVLT